MFTVLCTPCAHTRTRHGVRIEAREPSEGVGSLRPRGFQELHSGEQACSELLTQLSHRIRPFVQAPHDNPETRPESQGEMGRLQETAFQTLPDYDADSNVLPNQL